MILRPVCSARTPKIIPRTLDPRTHVVLSARRKQNGQLVTHSDLMRSLVKHNVMFDPSWRFGANAAGDLSRVFRAPGSNVWLVFGRTRGGFENPSSTFVAVAAALEAICAATPADEDPLEIFLPVTFSGVSDHTDVIRTSLSAVGHFLSSCQRSLLIRFDIPDSSSLWGEIHAGMIVPMSILKRGFDGHMSFTCAIPSRDGAWTVRRVETVIRTDPGPDKSGTFDDLRRLLQLRHLPPGYLPDTTLMTYIADGSAFCLQPVVIVADIHVTVQGDAVGRLRDSSRQLGKALGSWVRIIHVCDNEQVHQLLQEAPVVCIITSARQFGPRCLALELLKELGELGLEYFSGRVVAWSKSMLKRTQLLEAFRANGAYVEHNGSWEEVCKFVCALMQ